MTRLNFKRLALFVFGFCTATIAICGQAAISFAPFVTSANIAAAVGQNQTIGFAYAGNKFVGSVYFGQQLYQTNLTGGGVTTFGAPVAAFGGGETYVSSSLGIGGFGPRDIYAGNQSSNVVYRFSNDGSSQGAFVTSGISGGIRSIAFDPFGLYGNNMIVATGTGNVYRVDSGGTATFLANVGEDAEGLNFAPQAFGAFGTGTLFVASEGSGSLRAIDPGGTITPIVGPGSGIAGIGGAEMVSFVPLNLGSSGNPVEGFYAAAFPTDIQKADASQFAPYLGDAIITSETGHGVFDIHFNGTNFVVTQIGTFPAQPEDGIFVTADIIRNPVPEPESYAMLLAGLGLLGFVARRRKDPAA